MYSISFLVMCAYVCMHVLLVGSGIDLPTLLYVYAHFLICMIHFHACVNT